MRTFAQWNLFAGLMIVIVVGVLLWFGWSGMHFRRHDRAKRLMMSAALIALMFLTVFLVTIPFSLRFTQPPMRAIAPALSTALLIPLMYLYSTILDRLVFRFWPSAKEDKEPLPSQDFGASDSSPQVADSLQTRDVK